LTPRNGEGERRVGEEEGGAALTDEGGRERGVWARIFIFHYILKADSGSVGPEDG